MLIKAALVGLQLSTCTFMLYTWHSGGTVQTEVKLTDRVEIRNKIKHWPLIVWSFTLYTQHWL